MRPSTSAFAPEKEHQAFNDALAGLDLGGDEDLGAFNLWESLGLKKAQFSGNLSQGSSGDDVKTVQKKLAALGYTVPTSGTFGPDTTEAVRQFQTSQDLSSTGVVNAQTWDTLMKKAGGLQTVQTITDVFAVGSSVFSSMSPQGQEVVYEAVPEPEPESTNWLLIGGVAAGGVVLFGGLVWLATR